jgi:regulatory protein
MTEALERCYAHAMRILHYRFNSIAELRRKLARKGHESDAIDATVERLQNEKWLDDDRFAGAFVRTRSSRRIGKVRILRELQMAGVNEDSARQAVRENIDPEREREQLEAARDKRMRALIRRHGEDFLTTDEGRNKLTEYLLKQGYDAALVHSIVKETRVVHHRRNP